MNNAKNGQHVRLARNAPFFATETAGRQLLERNTPAQMKQKQSEFETMLREAGVSVGSVGVVDTCYEDGYVKVIFGDITLHLPLHLFD